MFARVASIAFLRLGVHPDVKNCHELPVCPDLQHDNCPLGIVT
jgi:hypothetical protein